MCPPMGCMGEGSTQNAPLSTTLLTTVPRACDSKQTSPCAPVETIVTGLSTLGVSCPYKEKGREARACTKTTATVFNYGASFSKQTQIACCFLAFAEVPPYSKSLL